MEARYMKNEIAWSDSKVKTLRDCLYKYYLTYYKAWNGWLSSASSDKQRAYLLKNITNLPMFVGSVVHDIIEKIITAKRDYNQIIPLEHAQEMILRSLRKGWIDSTHEKWKIKVKGHINLFEHFYEVMLTGGRQVTHSSPYLMFEL